MSQEPPPSSTPPSALEGALSASSAVLSGPDHDLRGVLRIHAFRRLWIALGLSSFGDWLGLLATTALAKQLSHSYSAQSFAIGGVLVVRLLPAVLLGPVAGAFADRFDRRITMVVCDVMRFSLFISIPIVQRLDWLYIASFLIEAISLFWIPAKEASFPNLLPAERLEAANQLSLITTYGTAPLAAAVFALLSLLNRVLASGLPFFRTNPVDLALYFNGVSFLVSALTVASLSQIAGVGHRRVNPEHPGFLRSITEGWAFVGQTPLVRGLVVGMLGAFAAGGCVIALGQQFVALLGGGDAAYGILFGAVFLGLAGGMGLGPRLFGSVSRRRLFGLAIIGAGGSLTFLSILPNLVIAMLFVVSIGLFAGVAWVIGYTLLGLEVANEMRGRTFAFVQSLVRVDLLLVLAVAPFMVGAIGQHHLRLGNGASIRTDGVTVVLFTAGIVAMVVGVLAFRQMNDQPDSPMWADLVHMVRRRASSALGPSELPGYFIAIEGGEGTGKSTQANFLAAAMEAEGYDVVVTREPGGSAAGNAIRTLLLDPATGGLAARTEALLYAADRAEHVASVIRPALERGAVVITDRYIDSSLAYQGAGRALDVDQIGRLSLWATEGLRPDLTVVLDLPPNVGLARALERGKADRLEQEQLEFHERVRAGFLSLVERDPGRYALINAESPVDQVAARVRVAVLAAVPGKTAARRFASAPTLITPSPSEPATP